MIKLVEWEHDALNTKSISSTFKNLRKEKGLTLRELAESAGLSLYTIQSIEKGRKNNPTLYTLETILDALGKELTIREKR